jgi:hypothetical protein
MKKCSKCEYIRQPNDDIFVSPLECPKCSILYDKHEDFLTRQRIEQKTERIAQEQVGRISIEQAETEHGQDILKNFRYKSGVKYFINNFPTENFFRHLKRNDTLCKVFFYIKDSKLIQWVIK